MHRRIRTPAIRAHPHTRRRSSHDDAVVCFRGTDAVIIVCLTSLHHPSGTANIWAKRAVIVAIEILGTALGTDPEVVVVVWCLCIVFGVAAQRAFGAPIVVFGTAVGADPEVGEGFSGHGVGVLVGCRLR
jgi:hypothetical protein